MPTKRLQIKLWACLTAFCLTPCFATIVDGDQDSGFAPEPPNFPLLAQNSQDLSSYNLTPEQTEQLKKKAMEVMNDPDKLQDFMKKMDTAQAQSNERSTSSSSTSSNTRSTRALSEEEAIKNEISDLRDKIQSPPDQSSLDDPAYRMLIEKFMPMSPEQIKFLHKLYDITQQATAETPNSPPTPKSSSSVVSLEPGVTPPVVRLAAGFVTSLVFTDSTGAPWPLESYTLGDPSSFNIQWDQSSNTIFIQSLKLYTHGNLAVTLHGNSTPVMISLVSGQKEVDFRIDYQIAGRGPEATAPIMSDSFSDASVNPTLINLLDGIPPKGSIKLNVSGKCGEAWLKDDTLYFRSKLTVLSPAWVGKVSSSDGTHVYQMMNTPSLLLSKDGQTMDVRLTGL